jgi:hypothetical protein
MAVTKGVYHINTAARKKARVAKYKRQVGAPAGQATLCGCQRSWHPHAVQGLLLGSQDTTPGYRSSPPLMA